MRPLNIAEAKVALQPSGQDLHGDILLQVDTLVFGCARGTVHEDNVYHPAAANHADANASVLQAGGEGIGCELNTLISVKHLRLGQRWRLLQAGQTKDAIQRVGELSGRVVTSRSLRPVHTCDCGAGVWPHQI